MASVRHDLVAFGATSFVGQILARYLYDCFGIGGPLRWAIAGRSKSKLEALRSSFGLKAAKLPIVVADPADERSIVELCRSARVVVSTVGPYALYGEPLVKGCAENGTDYCDLTGEVQWIGRMIAAHEPAARRSGARIMHCCGFDSIPSDLGVHSLQAEAKRRFGAPCQRVKMCVKAMRGGLSGGTVASMLNVIREAAADRALRRELANPYSLCPADHRPRVRQPDISFAAYGRDFARSVAPFVMAAINTRIVQRTNALLDGGYGEDFQYDEAKLNAAGSSTCDSSGARPTGTRCERGSPGIATRATGRPRRCSARPRRVSRWTFRATSPPAASGRRRRCSATG